MAPDRKSRLRFEKRKMIQIPSFVSLRETIQRKKDKKHEDNSNT